MTWLSGKSAFLVVKILVRCCHWPFLPWMLLSKERILFLGVIVKCKMPTGFLGEKMADSFKLE